MMASLDTLWLFKFGTYSKTKKSRTNRYIPQKGFDFLSQFRQFISTKSIELIYCGSNGPIIMSRPENKTAIPTKQFDLTIVTKVKSNNPSSIDQVKQSKDFLKLKQQFGIDIVYTIHFNINDSTSDHGQILPTLKSKIPSRPYPSGSYEWLANNPDKESINEVIKLCKIKNQPFMMLNLMQIVNEKEDKIYASKVMPLAYGIGGRAAIIGDTKDYWTQIVLMYYPNSKGFWEMITSFYYLPTFIHKHRSTKDVFVQMTIPLYCHPKYQHGELKTSKL